jgi:glutaryl-CoA dehydrogenase
VLDYYAINNLLSPEERQVQSSVRRFLEVEVAPYINEWWSHDVFPKDIIPRIAEIGLLGANLPLKYGASGLGNVAYGLIMYELERVDSALRSFVSVQGALVMHTIFSYGSEEQKSHYLPKLAKGELVGCFALTEHHGGSDPQALETTVRKEGDSFVISGSKMWITNGTIADLSIVWAKNQDGMIGGFIVPTDSPGFEAISIKDKMSMKASDTAELFLQDVRIPESFALPGALTLASALACLTQARYGIAWGALGALEDVYSEALLFAKNRSTFGNLIASRQLVQEKLVDMVEDHTSGLMLAWRLGQLKDEGNMSYTQVSLAKRSNVRAALKAARSARGILGASGITLDHRTIRHMLNLETVDTYEGTYDVHTLLLGRELTGISAF